MPQPEDESNPTEVAELNKKIESKLEELQRLDLQQEQYLAGFTEFLEHLADSSATPCLRKFFDPQKIELVGLTGRYGYVFRSDTAKGHLIKAIHPRWVSLAAREWMHGHGVGHHDHIVHYQNVFLHRDVDEELTSRVRNAFDAGTLAGQCPQAFPEYYFCVVLEHMDSGTVQSLLNRGLLPVGGIAEVCRSVAAALAYMHKMKRTHNDIRPDNVLLKSTPGSNHLIAKLADLGWAEHSTDRDRDNELFAYTIWCMGLNKKFRRVPALLNERQATVADLRKCGSECTDGNAKLWEQLAQITDGLWMQDLNMCQVRDWPELQHHAITKPCNEEVLEQLKVSATKNATSKKKSIVLQGRVERLPVSDSSRASVIQAMGQDDMEDDDEHDSFRSISPYGRAASANSRYSPDGGGSSSMMMESERLQKLLDEKTRDLTRLDAQFENEIEGYTQFLRSLTETSAADLLDQVVDSDNLEVLGKGNYGYVFSTVRRTTGERVVLKVQSPRWVSVCMQEWMHGSQVGHHANIVEHQCVLMHRDLGGNIESWIIDAFSAGVLSGKRPKSFPDTFVCIILEYMDRGTVQSLMDGQLLVLEGVAAVTRSVASALGYMHSKGLTHNDIKPENILLKRDQGGQHLVPKLADLGLAQHSKDQTRDREQFAYTVWCMGLNKKFTKVPDLTMQESYHAEFCALSGSQSLKPQLLASLSEAIAGIWRGQCLCELADWPVFRGCQVQEPRSEAARKTLEMGAKKETARRSLLIPSYANEAAMAANKMESQSKVAASRPPPAAIDDNVKQQEQSAMKIQKIFRGTRASVPEEEVFDVIDTDHNNVISRDEFREAVRSGIIVEDGERAQELVRPDDASTPSGLAAQGRMQTEVETPPLSAAAATAASDCLLPREDREDETYQKPSWQESASPPTPASERKLEDGSLPPDDMLPNIDSINEVLEDPSQEPWAGDDITVRASDPPSIHGDVSEPLVTSVSEGIRQDDLDQWSTADVNSTEHVVNLASDVENLHDREVAAVQSAGCTDSVEQQTETELFQTEPQRFHADNALNLNAAATHLVNDDALRSQMGMLDPGDASATVSNDVAMAFEQNQIQSVRDDQRPSGQGVNAEQPAAAPTGEFESNNYNSTGASTEQADNLQNLVVASVDNMIALPSFDQPGTQHMQLCPREEEELNHLLQHRQMIPGSIYSGMEQHPTVSSETFTPWGTSTEICQTLTSLAISAEPQEDCQQTHGAAETSLGDPSPTIETSLVDPSTTIESSLVNPSTTTDVPASGRCLDPSTTTDVPASGRCLDPSTTTDVPASGIALEKSEFNAGCDNAELSKLELELGPPLFTESLTDTSTSRELRDQYDKILSIYESLCLPGNDVQKEEVDQLRNQFNEMSSSSDSAKSDPKHEVVLLTNQLMGRNGEFDVSDSQQVGSDSLQVSDTGSMSLSVDALRQRYDELVSRFEGSAVVGSKDNTFVLSDFLAAEMGGAAMQNVYQHESLAPGEATLPPRCAPGEQNSNQDESLVLNDVTLPSMCAPAEHNVAQAETLAPSEVTVPLRCAPAEKNVSQNELITASDVTRPANLWPAEHNANQDPACAQTNTLLAELTLEEPVSNLLRADQAGLAPTMGPSSSAGREVAQNDVRPNQVAAGVNVDKGRKRPETAPAQVKSQLGSSEASRLLLDDLRDWSVQHSLTMQRASSPVDDLSADELRQRYDQITLKLEPLFTSVSGDVSSDIGIRQRQQERVLAAGCNAEAANLEPCNAESLADPSIFLPREKESSRRSSSSHSLNFDELRRRYEEIVLSFVPDNNQPAGSIDTFGAGPAGGRNDQPVSFPLDSAHNSYANQASSSSNGPALEQAYGFDRVPLAGSSRSEQNSGLREEGPGIASAAAVESGVNNIADHSAVQKDLREPGPAMRAALSAKETSAPRLQRDNFVAPLSAETTTGVGISKTTHSTRSCSLASLALAGEDEEDEPSTSAAEMTDLDRLLSSSLANMSWSSSSGQAVRQLSPQGPDGRCTADTLQYSPSPWPTRPNTELAVSASPWPQTRPVTELRHSETPGLQVQDTPSPFPQLISHSPSPFEATLLPGSALLEDGTSMLRPVSEDRTMPGSPLPDAAELDAEVRRSTSNLHLLAEQPVTHNGYCPQQVQIVDSELRTMTTPELRKANNKLRSEIEGLQAELERRRTEVGVWSAALAAVSYGPSPLSSRPGTRTESHPM